ncbi:hypothetical protein N7456_007028 [Penicillium angulare]|uniref:C2H2 type master regulator of conidiophore development brlA n=1 Tax=Penicillium angulare TaxID=116970 RepID=A0A9W9FIS8_9EURO|nr:hypothetical protein N7456_007028 [Penicillium angulare]
MYFDQLNRSCSDAPADWAAHRPPLCDTGLYIIPQPAIIIPESQHHISHSLYPQVAVLLSTVNHQCIATATANLYQNTICPGGFTNISAARPRTYGYGPDLLDPARLCSSPWPDRSIDLNSDESECVEPSKVESSMSCAQYEAGLPCLPPNIAAPGFICAQSGCNKIFKRQKNLSRHLNCHSGIRVHACWVPGCHRRFVRRDNLNSHYLTHGKPGGRNRYVVTLDEHSALYNPAFRGALTPHGWPLEAQ